MERIDAIQRFDTLYSSIVSCFESIKSEGSTGWSFDSLIDASTLLLAITTTDFVSGLVITGNSLNFLLSLTRSLQSISKDIVQAVKEISNLEAELMDKWNEVDSVHSG